MSRGRRRRKAQRRTVDVFGPLDSRRTSYGRLADYGLADWMRGKRLILSDGRSQGKAELAARVERDLIALGLPLTVMGTVEELPRPTPDLSAYADAFEQARKTCPHKNLVNILYQREWRCDDCHRILGPDDLPKRDGWSFFTY